MSSVSVGRGRLVSRCPSQTLMEATNVKLLCQYLEFVSVSCVTEMRGLSGVGEDSMLGKWL